MDAPQVRRAHRPAALAQGPPAGARCEARAGADGDTRIDRRVAGAHPVQADARAGARVARDQPRLEARDADAAALAGRCRQRQDDRRRARRAAGDRERPPGRADGADGNPRRAALPEARAMARRTADQGRLADRLPACQGAAERDGGDRQRRSDVRDRHARALRGRGGAAAPRARDRRRAASLRRRPAPEAPRQGDGRGAPADDERDADSAYAGDDVLRRPRRVVAGRDAAGTNARHHAPRQQPAAAGDRRAHSRGMRAGTPGVLGVSADRGIGKARAADRRRAPCRADRGAARVQGRPVARPDEARCQDRGDGRLRRRQRCRCWSRRR